MQTSKHLIHGLVIVHNPVHAAVFPEFLPIPQFQIEESSLYIMFHRRLVQVRVFQEIVICCPFPSVAVTDHHIAAARAKRKVQGMFQCPVNPSITSHVFTCPDMICAVSWFCGAVCIARPKAPESSETIPEADNIEIPFCPPSVSTGMSRS